jgi:hypothetical protein
MAATLQAFHTTLSLSNMLAYLTYMSPRLIELNGRSVLDPRIS